MLEVIIVVTLIWMICCNVYLYYHHRSRVTQPPPLKPEIQIIRPPSVMEDPEFQRVVAMIGQVPQKVVESVTSNANHHKGRLGEMIGYLHLNSQYDKLIVLRDITDFIGIRFPKAGDPGIIEFIDIKNGQYARLTKDQMALKKLIESKQVSFKKFKVDTDASSDDINSET